MQIVATRDILYEWFLDREADIHRESFVKRKSLKNPSELHQEIPKNPDRIFFVNEIYKISAPCP